MCFIWFVFYLVFIPSVSVFTFFISYHSFWPIKVRIRDASIRGLESSSSESHQYISLRVTMIIDCRMRRYGTTQSRHLLRSRRWGSTKPFFYYWQCPVSDGAVTSATRLRWATTVYDFATTNHTESSAVVVKSRDAPYHFLWSFYMTIDNDSLLWSYRNRRCR